MRKTNKIKGQISIRAPRYFCPQCDNCVAREDKRLTQPLVCMNGAIIKIEQDLAPKIKCICGHTIWLVKGSL